MRPIGDEAAALGVEAPCGAFAANGPNPRS